MRYAAAVHYPLKFITDSQTLVFRQQMLWPDKPLDHVKVPGDETAIHVGAFQGETQIGTGSFFPQDGRAQLRKLAVAPDLRGSGLGSQIVLFGAQEIYKSGCALLWCDARESALGFYQRLGFSVQGPAFSKSDLTYRKATLDLSTLFASV